MYLVLILVLLAGTVLFCLFSDQILPRNGRQSGEAAKEPIQPKTVSFRDITSCGGITIAVGRQGVIRVSTDDGVSWEDTSGGMWRKLNAVAFSGGCRVAIAVGRGGVIRVSTNGGYTWDTRESQTGNRFNDIALSRDGETAIAVGDRGVIRFSDDGGETWENPGNVTRQDVNGVALSRDGDTAVAVGGDNLIRVFTKQDGEWIQGKDWTDDEDNNAWTRSGGSKRDDFEAVALGSDGKSAVVVGDDGAILFSADVRTGDGGWSRETGRKDSGDFKDVAISENGKTAVAVGRRGTIWRSVDGGRSWSFRDGRQGNNLEAVAVSDDGKVAVAVGRDGTVLVSEDHGEGWTSRVSRTVNRLYGIAFGVGSRVAMIVGRESTILRSESAGGQVFPKMEVVPVAGDTRERQTLPTGEVSEPRDLADLLYKLANLLYKNALCTGLSALFMFMAHHLFGLLRDKFRHAASLDAVLLDPPKDALPPARERR